MGILDTPGYSRVAADTRFAPIQHGTRTIVLGDSIDAAAQGWFHYYQLGAKSFTVLRNAGIAGNTTAMMLARIQADVIAYKPDIVVLGGSTNDQGQGVATSVTRTNIAQMVTLVRGIGATPILRTTPPNDVAGIGAFNTIALRRAGIQQHNAWLKGYAQKNGIDVLDMYQSVADPVTGGYQAGISSDGTHPVETGYKAIANYLLALPQPAAFRGGFAFARAVAESGNMLTNGVFVGDANSDGIADSWAVSSGTPTGSLSAATTGITGNWQRVTTSNTATAGIWQILTSGYTNGDVVEVVGRVRTSGTGTALVRLAPFGSATLAVDVVASTAQPVDGVFSGRLTIPSDLTSLRLLVQQSTAAGWVEVAEVALRNLTQLGLA